MTFATKALNRECSPEFRPGLELAPDLLGNGCLVSEEPLAGPLDLVVTFSNAVVGVVGVVGVGVVEVVVVVVVVVVVS